MRQLTDLPGSRNYKMASDPDGRPLFVLAETVLVRGESHPRSVHSDDEIRTVVEAITGWCVAVDAAAIVRGRCLLLVTALGRRYEGWTYDRWSKLEADKVANHYGTGGRTGRPEASHVLGMCWSSYAVLPGATVEPMWTRSGKPARRFGRPVLAEVRVQCGATSWWPLFVDFNGNPVFHPRRRPEDFTLAGNLTRMRVGLAETIGALERVLGSR